MPSLMLRIVERYIDSGASSHMSRVREAFSEITEKDISVEVELGDDRVVRAVGRGVDTERGGESV